jgi:hypothetical protein
MIKYVCAHDYPPHKKGDEIMLAPPNSGNSFVRVIRPDLSKPEPLLKAIAEELVVPEFTKQPRKTITASRQEND